MAGIGFGTVNGVDNYKVVAGNGLGGNTYICTFDDVATTSAEAVLLQATAGDANNNVFTVAAVEGIADTDHFALQGTATPSLTNATVVATFTQG